MATSQWIVLDASALVELVLASERAAQIEHAVADRRMLAPDLINAEVVHTLRRLLAGGLIDELRARRAIGRLVTAPVRLTGTRLMVMDAWSLRHNVSGYDAAYVGLARRIRCPLVTVDQRLARAPGLEIEVLAPEPTW